MATMLARARALAPDGTRTSVLAGKSVALRKPPARLLPHDVLAAASGVGRLVWRSGDLGRLRTGGGRGAAGVDAARVGR